jgi:ABC-2 type transport system permease protein
LVAAKAAAIGVIVLIIALATWAGMIFGVGVAAAVGIVGWLINGFAPLVSGLGWSKYLSLFYYYAGHDPLTQGVDIGDIIVLLGLTLLLTGLAMLGIERRDLRG